MKEESSKGTPPLIRKKGGSKMQKSLGPVINLEEHVYPDWWRRIFNSIYLKTDADVVEDSEKHQRGHYLSSCFYLDEN